VPINVTKDSSNKEFKPIEVNERIAKLVGFEPTTASIDELDSYI
jgi:hypothetical protein